MNDNNAFVNALKNKKIFGKFVLENFSYEILNSILLDGVIFENCEIHNISIISDDFSNCTFENCKFVGGAIEGSVFRNCKIISLEFLNTSFSASFYHSEIEKLDIFW